jgi:hypothetical protein
MNYLRHLACTAGGVLEEEVVGVCTLEQIHCARRLFLTPPGTGTSASDSLSGLQACLWSQTQRMWKEHGLWDEWEKDWPDIGLRRQLKSADVCSDALISLVHRREENQQELEELMKK